MKKKLVILSMIAIFCMSLSVSAIDIKDGSRKKKKKKSAISLKSKTPEQISKEKYEKIIKGATKKMGLFTTYFTNDGKLYFELNKAIEEEVLLISNRISSTTKTNDFVAGQMVVTPFMIRFTVDTSRIVMYKVQTDYEVKKGDPISISFERNNGDPILKTFKPVAKMGDKVLIDMTAFFGTDEKSISPIKEANPLAMMFGGKPPVSGRFIKDDSYISEVKNFPKNIEIKSLLNYDLGGSKAGYTLGVHRSIILLPKVLMARRIQDNRIGYFSNKISIFSSKKDGIYDQEFIQRWRLEPKDEDKDKYFSGQLVEPKNPIIFYIDNAFPEKWRKTVMQGVEDWQIAFEAAGFKNAIQARMYPTKEENPDFDPDDMRFSCVKYATVDIANAMGPSHIDPRSGEILTGDVLWYHNVVSLVHNWKFVQTAAVDPRARKSVFDNDLMCESLRYVTSHEIGHTLGLMHNMGASYSYPVDSLRSPSFTQEYGTTPSIMDYARNNFIAQPGDFEKGVKLTPPILGVYDVHAINWGYRLFKGESTKSEKKNLDKIILDKSDDDMYRFGAQQVIGNIDATDLTEDLSDNHVQAAIYCIKNLKIILNNLEEWHGESSSSYSELVPVYKEVLKQYLRVVMHVIPEVGGLELKEVMQGEPKSNKTIRYFTKAEQKRAMLFIINQARTCSDWITPDYVVNRFSRQEILPHENSKIPGALTASMFSHTAMGRMYEASTILGQKDVYSVEGYMNDLMNEIFKPTLKGNKLSSVDMDMQIASIDKLISLSDVKQEQKVSKSKKLTLSEAHFELLYSDINKPTLACGYSVNKSMTIDSHSAHSDDCGCNHGLNGAKSFFRVNMSQVIAPKSLTQPLWYAKLLWVKDMYASKVAKTKDRATKDFYMYQIMVLNKVLNPTKQ